MHRKNMLAFLAAFSIGTAAAAQGPACPKWEPGARYPWQSNIVLRDDRFAWLVLEVDRKGFPIRCRVGSNNLADNEERFWLCKQYSDRWRGPPAVASDPDRRTLQRYSLIPGPKHQKADKIARTAWFNQHPQERKECYPEPSRPDRLDL